MLGKSFRLDEDSRQGGGEGNGDGDGGDGDGDGDGERGVQSKKKDLLYVELDSPVPLAARALCTYTLSRFTASSPERTGAPS